MNCVYMKCACCKYVKFAHSTSNELAVCMASVDTLSMSNVLNVSMSIVLTAAVGVYTVITVGWLYFTFTGACCMLNHFYSIYHHLRECLSATHYPFSNLYKIALSMSF